MVRRTSRQHFASRPTRSNGGISRLLVVLLSRVGGWIWRSIAGFSQACMRWWRESREASTRTRERARPSEFQMEALEPRVLLSADLSGSFSGLAASGNLTPGAQATVQLQRTMDGLPGDALPAGSSVQVKVYASSDNQLDGSDILVGQASVAASQFAESQYQLDVPLDTGALHQAGSFTLIGVVDPADSIAESNESNNVFVTTPAQTLQVSNSFGLVNGKTIPSLTLTDMDGTRFTLTLSGNGAAQLDQDANGYRLLISGTDTSSQISMTASGGNGQVTFSAITANSALKSIVAAAAELKGPLTVAGPLSTLTLGNASNAVITTQGTGLLDLSAQSFNGVRLLTTQTLNNLQLAAWNSPSSGASLLQAAGVNNLQVTGDFAADVALSGISAGALVLGTAKIGGTLGASQWNITGRAGSLTAGLSDIGWHANVKGAISQFITLGNASGLLAASSLQLLQIGGAAKNFTALIGADLGSDAALGGTGAAADTFAAGTLARLRVNGDVIDSLFIAGVDPRNGVFNDGDDVMKSLANNALQELTVNGQLMGATRIIAGALPATVVVGGQAGSSSGLAQLSTKPVDITPPTLKAGLQTDTGATGDGLTSNPAVAGSASDVAGKPRLYIALDPATAGMTPSYDASAAVQADGSFVIDAALLNTLAGGTLADGAHTVRLMASDAAGNRSLPADVSFVLDTKAPMVLSVDLSAASDTGTAADQITSASVVTLIGRTEANASVSLAGTSLKTTAQADGSFQFAGLALAAGANAFTIEVADAAGNASRRGISITRAEAPVVQAALSHDTGSSDADRLTSDASIKGNATGTLPMLKLLAALDPAAGVMPAADLSGALKADGSFIISAAQLDALAGGKLVDGAHSLRIVAIDNAGHASVPVDVAFNLDTAAPAVISFDLDPASDTDVAGDRITSQATVILAGVAEANASVRLLDSSLVTQADAAGKFRFEGIALVNGVNNFAVEAVDAAGNAAQRRLTVTRSSLDAIAPTLSARLARDSGRSGTDGITQDVTISGNAADNVRVQQLLGRLDSATNVAAGIDLTALLQADGSFTIGAADWRALAAGALNDGQHTLRLSAVDAAGNVTMLDLPFTLDTSAPVLSSFQLAAADAVDADRMQTYGAVAQLRGVADPGAVVSLAAAGISALASDSGSFVLPNVSFALGDNQITLTATDAAGNSSTITRTITRLAQTRSDAVLDWNTIALKAIQADVTDPPIATRVLAIESIAIYDTLAAIEGTPAYLVQQSVSGAVSTDAAVAAAAHRVLYQLYPGQRASLDQALAGSLSGIADGAAKTAGIELGKRIADAVLAIRASDGYLNYATYDGSSDPGKWRPTGPMYLVADDPQWKDVSTFALASASVFRPDAPPALDSAQYMADLEQVRLLGGAVSSNRTADQTQQALFWADGGGSVTPPGHWNQIATQVAAAQGNSMSANARLMAQLNIALADAAIACWDAKYTYGSWRPVTAIQNADQDNNPGTLQDATWQPLLLTPPHPEYVSGHSTFSAAAAGILAATFGDDVAFSTTSSTLPGATRSFTSFSEAADEAGQSRIYGGIHFGYSNEAGASIGQKVASAVLARFATADDTQAPVVLMAASPAAANANLTLTGQILDNLSGVASAQYRIDNGDLKTLTLEENGRFSITTAYLLDGSQDGGHSVTILARDAAGNLTNGYTRGFTLDTKAPTATLTSLAGDAVLAADNRLTGMAGGTGSNLVSLTYRIDNGPAKSISFDTATGAFDTPLSLGNLGIGNHTLTLRAQDAAGNVGTLARNVVVDSLAPFSITKVTPDDGSGDVGTTYRPQVYFSRAVNANTLTSDTFYATGPDGSKLSTTIVPALDGSFAWLLFNNPMPGGSTVTLHLNGSAIRAQADGTFLDGDANGTVGGEKSWSFTTVSTAAVAGTRLVGKVVDPGADLLPMTFDDIRRGADGVLHTDDDVFLNPIVHAKVYVLGRPDLVTYTDQNGAFSFDNLPVGDVKVAVDGRTATNSPSGVFWPEMVMNVALKPGVTNTVMGGMGSTQNQADNAGRQEIYLPRVQSSAMQQVSNTEATTITVNAASAPGLTDEQRSELTLTVRPGSAVGADGKVLTDVKIGINTVPSELVKDMLPLGILEHTFDITIQAPGVDVFTQPVQITFPNVFDAAPGTQLNILSFDHTTGRLVINGTATVSADGKTVTSDEGSGVVAPGWHGLTPPGSGLNGGPGTPCNDDGSATPSLGQKWRDVGQLAIDLRAIPTKAYAFVKKDVPSLTSDVKFITGSLNADNSALATLGLLSNSHQAKNAAEKAAAKTLFQNALTANSYIGAAITVSTTTYDLATNWDQYDGWTRTLKAAVVAGAVAEAGLVYFTPYGWAKTAYTTVKTVNDAYGFYKALRDVVPDGKTVMQDLISSSEPCSPSMQPQAEAAADAATKALDNIARKIEEAAPPIAKYIDDNLKVQQSVKDFADKIDKAGGPGNITREMLQEYLASAPPIPEVPDDGFDPSIFQDIADYIGALGRLTDIYTHPSSPSLSSPSQNSGDTTEPRYYWMAEFNEQVVRGSSADGSINLTVAPNTIVQVSEFGPRSNTIGTKVVVTSTAGGVTNLGRIYMTSAQGLPDKDGDGLVDQAEAIVGTSPTNKDTDGDGINDYAELLALSNPLDNIAATTGINSAIQLNGSAEAISLPAASGNNARVHAYVATGDYGLAIVDITNPSKPTVSSQLDLAGINIDVAADSSRGVAAVAAGASGLHLVDISNAQQPKLQQTLAFAGAATAVRIDDGFAYVAAGATIAKVDLNTGELRDSIDLSRLGVSALRALAIDNHVLYALDTSNVLRAVDLRNAGFGVVGTLSVGAGGGKLFVGGDIAYVGAGNGGTGGFATVDVKNPSAMRLLSGVDNNGIGGASVVPNGSGLAVAVGSSNFVFGAFKSLDLIDVSDPTNTGKFITRFTLPADPKDVVIANGVAFVADGKAGLQVVNYTSLDSKGVAPSVSMDGTVLDIDAKTAGIQVLEGSIISLRPTISDDVQVRNVELLINGESVGNDANFPWQMDAQIPVIAQGGATITLQLRATDTGGNSSLSPLISLDVVPDTFPPRVTSISLDEGARVFFARSLDIGFNEAIDLNKFDAAGVHLVKLASSDSSGASADQPVEVRLDTRANGQLISVIPGAYLTPGNYRLSIDPSIISDKTGNSLETAIIRNFSIRPASDIRAANGIPAITQAPSTNPGQLIGLPVPFDARTAHAVFVTIDSNGTKSSRDLATTRYDTAKGLAYFTVPMDATTGTISVYSLVGTTRTDFADGTFLLQVLPTVSSVKVESVSSDGTSATVLVSGSGFVEGGGSEYRFGNVVVTDASVSAGPDVFDRSQVSNGYVRLTVPLSSGAMGPISVRTAGGTSALFSVDLASIDAVAYSGTPADPTQASANAGQAITLRGSGLSVATDVLLRWTDTNGTLQMTRLNPQSAAADGTSASLIVPAYANGVFALQVFGSSSQPLLQIVPTLKSYDMQNTLQFFGSGFVEGDGTYRFAGATAVDDATGNSLIDVSYNGNYNNGVSLSAIALPHYGFGGATVTTAGGTSAALALNVLRPGTASAGIGSLGDVAVDPSTGAIWTADAGSPASLLRIDPATGLVQQSITLTNSYGTSYLYNNAGLQIVGQAMTLGGTAVPAGSLLVFNGYANPDQVTAINPANGAVLATLRLAGDYNLASGVFDAQSNSLFVTSSSNQLLQLDAGTGALLKSYALSINTSNSAGMAIDPVTGNLWIGSYYGVGTLVQVSRDGVELKQVDLAAQGVNGNEISGLAFTPDGSLLVSSSQGVIYRVNPNAATVTAPTPVLTQIVAKATDGTAANTAVASANAGQIIELRGSNFADGISVLFATRDNAGNLSVLAVTPTALSADGARLQVKVPDLASTGDIRVLANGNASSGLRLQIVPTLTGMSGRAGSESSFDLLGSGFMDGASTITIGGTVLTDSYANLATLDVTGARNDTYTVVAPLTLDGPIRVTTEGGYMQLGGPVLATQTGVLFAGISATAQSGVPVNAGLPSANSGQTIVLQGQGFNSSTLVQFAGIDDKGVAGTLTRTGTASSDGRTLSIVVPALARSGQVRVLGDDTVFNLQVVPTLRAMGGQVLSGNTLVLEGTGLVGTELTLQVNGRSVGVFSVRTITDGSNNLPDQQLLTLTVPDAVALSTNAVITVSTSGGAASLRTGLVIADRGSITPATEVGDTLATAVDTGLPLDSSAVFNGRIGDGTLGIKDVDLYKVTVDQPTTVQIGLASTTLYSQLRLFDANGTALTSRNQSINDSGTITLTVAAGTYYVGVSGYSNTGYDPKVAGSGSGNTSYVGDYALKVQLQRTASSRLNGIDAGAASGTPASAGVASANAGQSIVLRGAGLLSTDRVVFTVMDDGGNLSESTVTTAIVNTAAQTISVVVPTNAVTGRVRLERDATGQLLQIVPTLTDLTMTAGSSFTGSNLRLTGSGFIEGDSSVLFGSQRLDDAGHFVGLDVFSNNGSMNLAMPSGVPTGPIRVVTAGGTSAAFNVGLSGIVASAGSGLAADAAVASANPGQLITLNGQALSLTSSVVFQVIDGNGNRGNVVVRPSSVSSNGSQAQVIVPLQAVTGTVGVLGDINNTQALLQVLPTVSSVKVESVSSDGTSATVLVSGSGFVEGGGSEYRFGNVVVTDASVSAGPDVFDRSQVSNGYVRLTVPLSSGAMGPISVRTAGGTSALFSVDLASIDAVAYSGTPADPTQASANAGQAITLRGSGLSVATDVLLRWTDTNGMLQMTRLNPQSAAADGTSASLIVPAYANGVFALQVFGSSSQPLLQIVPTLKSYDMQNTLQFFGSGFVEGDGTYRFAGATAVDDATGNSLIDVSYNGNYNNGVSLSAIALPHYGFGGATVTTAGGTSAALALNVLRPGTASAGIGSLGDVAVDPSTGAIWTADAGSPASLLRIDPATGLVQQSITLTNSYGTSYLYNNAGLQIVGQAMTLGGTAVPAGSLLVFNGYANPDQVTAINPANGAVLATLRLAGDYNLASGVFDAQSNSLFVTSSSNQLLQLDAGTGALLKSYALSINTSNSAGMAIDPVTGNLWIGSYYGVGTLVQVSRDGVELKQVDLAAQGVNGNEISGLAFTPDGSLLVSSSQGVIYRVNPNAATVTAPTPVLTQIVAKATDGTAANTAVASANAGQIIELRGSNFADGISVLFATRDNAGNLSVLAVTPTALSADGARLQVKVPDLASTGDIRVLANGNASSGLRLQIVPTLTGMSGRAGSESSFDLLGSGFMDGASTITIGGTVLTDSYANLATLDVTGARNDTYTVVAPLTLDGPIRVTTEGGYMQLGGPVLATQTGVLFAGISATAQSGVPVNAGLPSANSGQTIVLQGQGFNSSTLVQFAGIDDKGVAGTLTRTGTASSDGRTLSIVVPALARSGQVRVLGDDTVFNLQVVPTLRAMGGQVLSGNTLVLEGTGLVGTELTLQVNGRSVGVFSVRTITDGSNNLPDQQLLTLTVPDAVALSTNAVITVSTSGGAASLRTGLVIADRGSITPATEVGDTLATAVDTGLPLDSSAVFNGRIGDGTLGIKDVDLYKVTVDQPTTVQIGLASTTLYSQLRLFDANGTALTSRNQSINDSGTITLTVAAGTYYVGVSGYSNTGYDPKVAGSGSGNTSYVGDYALKVQLQRTASSRLNGIDAGAASGTPASAGVASANAGQSIVLRGAGLLSTDRVVFTVMDDGGNLSESTVTTAIVNTAAQTISVVVPTNAVTGRVRLERDATGQLLQIVPTLTDLTMTAGSSFTGSNLRLTGSGFIEGDSSVLFGSQRLDDAGHFVGLDVFSNNGSMNLAMPSGVPTGPIRVVTAGGTSAAFNVGLSGIVASAGSGLAADAAVASANPGQLITLNGQALSLTSSVVFQVIDGNGNRGNVVVRPSSVSSNGSQAQVIVPLQAVTGTVGVLGDINNTQALLQVLPTVSSVKVESVSSDGTSATVLVSGSGFVEGGGSEYRFGNVVVTDASVSAGPDVFDRSQVSNGYVRLTVPLSSGAMGPISVRTAGGTSALFSVDLASIDAVAYSGTPADPTQASANAGQAITLRGSGLSVATDVLLRWTDTNGTLQMTRLNPQSAAADGTSASLIVPAYANGVFALQVFGSSSQPLLQIVPTLKSYDMQNTLQFFGSGFVEGDGTYRFAGATAVDDATGNSLIDVSYNGNYNNGVSLSAIALPHYGFGGATVTTAGGTSAALALNVLRPGTASAGIGSLGDVAVDPSTGAIWTADAGSPASLLRIDPATGLVQQSITLTNSYGTSYLYNNAGLQIVGQAMTLGGTAVPAGSLLVFNGYANPDQVTAINPANGAVLATLRLAGDYNLASGVFDAQSNSLFVTSSSNQLLQLDAGTGALLKSYALSINTSNSAGMAIDPVTGNLWIGSYYGVGTLVQVSRDGVELKQVDLAAQGVNGNEISGLAFMPDGSLLVASTQGVIYQVKV